MVTIRAEAYREKLCMEACEGIDNAFLVAWNHGAKTNGGKPWSDRIDEMLSELFALKQTLEKERAERKAVIDDVLVANNDLLRRERDLLRVALKDIAGTTNRTATPERFIRHLQKIAADALGGKYEG